MPLTQPNARVNKPELINAQGAGAAKHLRQLPNTPSGQMPGALGAVRQQAERGLHKHHSALTAPSLNPAGMVQLKTNMAGNVCRPLPPPHGGAQCLSGVPVPSKVIQRATSTGGEPPPEPTTKVPPKKRIAKKTNKSSKRRLKDNFSFDRGDKIYGGGTYYQDVAKDIAEEVLGNVNLWQRITIQSFVQAVSAAIKNDPSYDPDPDPNGAAFVSFVHGKPDDSSSRYKERVTTEPDKKLISRLSKAAVEYAVRANYHVHFVLGKEFTSQSVASKSYNSVTSRELRFIYRNWKSLSSHVTFYDQSKWEERPALWEEDPGPWIEYEQRRNTKA